MNLIVCPQQLYLETGGFLVPKTKLPIFNAHI